MELTYKVKGADGKDYGPVSLEQLLAWMREGRVSGKTEVMRSDVDYWATASQYSELQVAPPETVGAPPITTGPFGQPSPVQSDAASLTRMKADAGWFYWIAGFSLFNSISQFANMGFYFAFGLGITRLFDAFGTWGLAVNVVIVGIFILFGVFASKGHLWAFAIGTILFALDTWIFVRVQLWLGVAFHVLALFFLIRGCKACWDLRRN